MRTDAKSDLLRRVGDDSPWFDKALFHAILALEEIAEETGTPYGRIAARALDKIERQLAAPSESS